MKTIQRLLAFLVLASSLAAATAPTPGGKIGVAVDSTGGLLQFLRVNSSGYLLLAAAGPGLGATPPGQVGIALNPDGNIAFLQVDSTGGLLVAGMPSPSAPLSGANGGTGVANTGKTITLGGNVTTSGAFNLALTLTGTTSLTLPTSGTVATLAGAAAFTNKTYNGNTWTAGTGTLTIAAGKTLTASNTLTFSGTDGSSLAIGTGGTLGTAAYTAASAYEVPITFSTGLTRTVNTVTVNASQSISTLSNLTSNGLVTTSGGTGALSVTAAGQIAGTATNDDAAAGKVGEYMSQTVAFANRVSMSNGTAAAITSLTLTAGDWDVSGVIVFSLTTATATSTSYGINSTGSNLGGLGTYAQDDLLTTALSFQYFKPTPTVRVSVAGSTSYYLVGQISFSGGTVDGFGFIRARRVR